jgi:UrcA family protein
MNVIRALAALSLLSAPALVTAAPPAQTTVVDFGDLDLASDKGQRVLALRIRRAAAAMCEAEALGSLPQSIRSERACIREAQSGAAAAARIAAAAAEPAENRGG